jgi:2-polyprenyl-6-methoxyphenol hydroxylase-like FAD-dependent oxidoreductase
MQSSNAHTSASGARLGAHALVLGGGVTGVASAAMLARHFERVTLVERDRYEGATEVREHAPHGGHAHILLAGGLLTLTRLFPALPARFDDAGFAEGDLTMHTRVAYRGQWLPKAQSGIPIRSCTRPEVEHVLRGYAEGLANVTLRDGCEVRALLGGSRVRGATIVRDGVTEHLDADLVVDAMGRASPSVRWLAATVGVTVDEERVDPGVVYASAWFELPPRIDDDWTVLATLPAIPEEPMLGVMLRTPSRGLLCSLACYGRPKAPKTAEELVERFRGAGVREPHALLSASRPTSPVAVYGNTQNRRRRFERARWFPEGLVILGDAACALNPRYGQGITVAALSVEQLERSLVEHRDDARSDGLRGLSKRFQKSLSDRLDLPWQMALLEDRGWTSMLEGRAPSAIERLALAGAGRVLDTSMSDIDAYIRFMRVAHLIDPPTKMLAPAMLAALARGPRRSDVSAPPAIGAAVQ